MYFILFSLYLAVISTNSALAATECEQRLAADNQVLSEALEHEKTFTLGLGKAPHRLTREEHGRLKPNLIGRGINGKKLPFRLEELNTFDGLESGLRKKGFWILFTPTPARFTSATPVGHSWLLVDGMLYSRSVISSGPGSVDKIPWEKRDTHPLLGPMLKEAPFITAQFFELDSEALTLLSQFAESRAEGQLTGDAQKLMPYKFRPLSKYANEERAENCNTFCFSWSHPTFVMSDSKAESIQRHLGSLTLNEMPNLQVTNNVQVPAYRGTLLLTNNRDALASLLLSGEFLKGTSLRQIFSAQAVKAADNGLGPIGRGYFLMPRIFKEGKLQDIITGLPSLKKMGVQTLWLGPIHPQTTFESSSNTHGYWPADHSAIDPKLGTEAEFKTLIDESHKLGIEICLDAVVNHFGYSENVSIQGKKIETSDRRYFKGDLGAKEKDSFEQVIREMETTMDPVRALALQKELATHPLFSLPSLQHNNPEVAHYLLESYKRFIDLGVDAFRFDAAKHIDFDFLISFMQTLTQYARSHGRQIDFIWEYTGQNSHTIALPLQEALNRLTVGDNVYFYDFPLAYELRRLDDPAFKLSWLVGFHRYRVENHHPLSHYIPMIENHDNLIPIKNEFVRKAAYLLSEALSLNPTFLSHGTENHKSLKDGRTPISRIDDRGDLAVFLKKTGRIFQAYNEAGSVASDVYASDDILVLKREIPGWKTVFILVNKSKNAAEGQFDRPSGEFKLKTLLESGNANLIQNQGQWKFSLAPESFAIIESKLR